MRLVLTIVSFCLALVFLGAGIAQRTVFLKPDSVSMSIDAKTSNVYTVISAEALRQHSGAVTVTAQGSGPVVIAYGRTDDVQAWIGAAHYTRLSPEGANALKASNVVPELTDVDPNIPVTGSPAGSDLWISEVSGTGGASLNGELPEGTAAIIASDGQNPAPANIKVAWRLDSSTPWAGPLLSVGALFLLVGLVFLLFFLRDHLRGGGPRRKGPASIEHQQPSQKAITAKGPKRKELGPARGRRTGGRVSRWITIPMIGVGAFALSGCSPSYWPAQTVHSTAAASAQVLSADGQQKLEPAVTEAQAERILAQISSFTANADSTMAADTLSQRFAGPALAARLANYQIRAKKSDYAAPTPIPAAPITLTLPQQVSNSWPRLVLTVSQDPSDSNLAPVALVMLQDSPRVNYHVYYAMTLAPKATSPRLAPATIGAPRVPVDSKLVEIAPNEVASAYGDVLTNDTSSAYNSLFNADDDTLRQQLGAAGQADVRSKLPANAAIAFSASSGNGPALGFATIDGGALVAVEVSQQRKITPTDGGVVGFGDGSASALLSGFAGKSARGVQSTTSLQVLFYIPAVGSTDHTRVIGWTANLIAASEIPG